MTRVLSVDLAYVHYADIGVALLEQATPPNLGVTSP